MPTHLDQILSHTLIRVMDRRRDANFPQLERAAAAHIPRGFARAIRAAAANGPAIIAELKKASPSKGIIREDYRPVSIAKTFASSGATALSVLTNEEFFRGSLADLAAVSKAVTIPVLCKDFILDPFQILEARAAGADAILLIVAAHTDDDLQVLADTAHQMNLDILCEVHDRDEMERAARLDVQMIGVNCRDLRSFAVDPKVHMDLARYLPARVLRVAESGIRTPADVERLLSVGYDAFLVGEVLMRQPDPAATLAMLAGNDYASEL